jgi:regulation of enolase protein 1 (concanavalin A-like superfamily)
MRLVLALLLCGVGVSALAAPAPFPRQARQEGVWYAGWDAPADPLGDCRFVRRGGSLTIGVPSGCHDVYAFDDRLNAPHLMRDVEGDFCLTVRVNGGELLDKDVAWRSAGLLLLAGARAVSLELLATDCGFKAAAYLYQEDERSRSGMIHSLTQSDSLLWLRLRRQGDEVMALYSKDGQHWRAMQIRRDVTFPARLRVGVFASVNGSGAFEVVFDKLAFTGSPSAPRARK